MYIRFRNIFLTFLSTMFFAACEYTDKSFPTGYNHDQWIELKIISSAILDAAEQGLPGNAGAVINVENKVIYSEKMLSDLSLSRYGDKVDFNNNIVVFSPNYKVGYNEVFSINEPRIWVNFKKKQFYVRHGAQITKNNTQTNTRYYTIRTVIPKIPEDFEQVKGYTP